jgi:glucose dehydrogenase
MRNIIAMMSITLCLLVSNTLAYADESWPMYGRNLRHTFTNDHSLINPQTVLNLKPAWDFPTEDVVTASPTVVDGVVYVGAWDGYFYALEASSGALIWKFAVDCQNTIVPIPPRCPQPLDAAFEQVPHAQVAADLLCVNRLVFEGEGGAACYDDHVRNV